MIAIPLHVPYEYLPSYLQEFGPLSRRAFLDARTRVPISNKLGSMKQPTYE